MTSDPNVFAYDGSDLAKLAIDEAGRLLDGDNDAIVLTVWQPFNVAFVPIAGLQFNAAQAVEVRRAAEETAAEGAKLAEAAGFRARSRAIEAAPTWKGIVEFADSCDARLIVLGSHSRSPLAGVVIGSVAGAVASHSRRSVLIVHLRAEAATAS
jgi:nucleotide-binding universal stress UspA family protein